MNTYSAQKAYRQRKYTEGLGQACKTCGVSLTEEIQSKSYPGSCKSCSTDFWKDVSKRSIDRRMVANIGEICRKCKKTELTLENQTRSYPGVCKPCHNAAVSLSNESARPVRVQNALGKLCRSCQDVELTPDNQSLSYIGFCKSCASTYGKAQREHRRQSILISATVCRDCQTVLNEETISRSNAAICKRCHSQRHLKYEAQAVIRYHGKKCSTCTTILDMATQSLTHPNRCLSCIQQKTKSTFVTLIGHPCQKCGTTLTETNQSKAHLGKCKPCRNNELMCAVCGNRGGIYKGKRCATCRKWGK